LIILWIAAAVGLLVFGHFSIEAAILLGAVFSVVVVLALSVVAVVTFILGPLFLAIFTHLWFGCSYEDLKESVRYMMNMWPETKSSERHELLDLIENERWSIIVERWETLLHAMKRDLLSNGCPDAWLTYREFANMRGLIDELARRPRRVHKKRA
jgi:hypothetical protein